MFILKLPRPLAGLITGSLATLLAACATAPHVAEPARAPLAPAELRAPPPSAQATPLGEPAAVSPAQATPVVWRSDRPLRYTVRKGDTLWDISARFLRDPWRWPEVWHANPQVRNPHCIYPGDVLEVAVINGQTVLQPVEPPLPAHRLSPEVRRERWRKPFRPCPMSASPPFSPKPRRWTSRPSRKRLTCWGRSMLNSSSWASEIACIFVAPTLPSEPFSKWLAIRACAEKSRYRKTPRQPGGSSGYDSTDSGGRSGGSRDHAKSAGNAGRKSPAARAGSTHYTRSPASRARPADFGSNSPALQCHFPNRSVSIRDPGPGQRRGSGSRSCAHVYRSGAHIPDPVRGEQVALPEEAIGEVLIFRVFEGFSQALIVRSTRSITVGDRVANPP